VALKGFRSVNGKWVLALWLIVLITAYFALGGYLAERVEGVAGTPGWWLLIFGLSFAVAAGATVWWAATLTIAARAESTAAPASGRRKFLTGGAAMTGGLLGVAGATTAKVSGWATVTGPALAVQTEQTATHPKAAWRDARIQHYRPLGRTGLRVSDISAGSTRLHQNPDPVGFLNAMLDRGVNYIDASPDYAPESEAIIKSAIAGRDRSELVIATKFCTSSGHLRQGSSVQEYMRSMESALSRMGTEYVDVAHIHACDTVDRLMDENVHEAVDRLREQGKVRFMGVSTHTPNLEEVANTAIDSGRFDVMMLAYHHGAWPNQQAIIRRAAEQGIGIVAMKTLKGAKHNGLAGFNLEADSYSQAAFKWVLSNPDVANLVISFHNDQHLDEYLFASGQMLTSEDVAVLDKYDELIAGTHCFQHCGDCLDRCPSQVPIHDVLRHRMYFEDYGDQKQAMQGYARLTVDASACLSCDAPCAGGCPQGIPIHDRMVGAHIMLT
jgi:predicted aldo/keto reductase-like oxidoreductase